MSIFQRKNQNYFSKGDLAQDVRSNIKGRVIGVNGKFVTLSVRGMDGKFHPLRLTYKRLTRIATSAQIAHFYATRQPVKRKGIWQRIKRFFSKTKGGIQ